MPFSFASGLLSCFTYPLNIRYLLVILGAALFGAIVSLFPMGNDIGWWFIQLVVARVGFDIVDRFAAGHIVHADTPHGFPSGGFTRPIKYWLILVGMDFLVSRYFRKYGYAAGLGMDIVTSLVLPGMTIVLAMTSSLRSAFNPREWMRVANAAPGTFILLAFLSLGIDQLTALADKLLFPPLPENLEVEPDVPLLPIAFYTVIMVYLWLVNFCMIGLAVHANRDALDALEGAAPGKAAEPAPPARAAPVALSPRERLTKALKDGDKAAAVALYRECAAADPQFRPAAEEVLPLARVARSEGETTLAVAIVRGFDKLHPGHADIPQVYFFSAQMLAEDLHDADMARKILQHVLSRYPGHYVAPEAKRYLQAMPGTG
jgi:hypothetical protein